MEIANLKSRQVWDSRGRPTIEVEVILDSGATGRSIAPSGASTGRREALDRRDGGSRLGGFGVSDALRDIDAIIQPALLGMDAADQPAIDGTLLALDGTPQKTRLGGNALVAVSQAVAWAAAAEKCVPLWRHLRDLAGLPPELDTIPAPMIQIYGGGRHAAGRVDVQDFLVICLTASSFAEACEWTAEIYLAAAKDMAGRGHLTGVADEGGLWPDFARNEEGIERLATAIGQAGFAAGRDVGIALDVAASAFAQGNTYPLALEDRTLTSNEMAAMVAGWCERYPIVSLEDPLGEDDTDGWVALTNRLGSRIQLIGDDYLTTNAEAVREASRVGACNAVLLKANQCGTLTELIAASAAARAAGWNAIQSGRSGESEDVTLSHLAIGLQSDQVKVGSITRSERTAKWNEVLRIEEGVGPGHLWHFANRGGR